MFYIVEVLARILNTYNKVFTLSCLRTDSRHVRTHSLSFFKILAILVFNPSLNKSTDDKRCRTLQEIHCKQPRCILPDFKIDFVTSMTTLVVVLQICLPA